VGDAVEVVADVVVVVVVAAAADGTVVDFKNKSHMHRLRSCKNKLARFKRLLSNLTVYLHVRS
jgi:hypothetical protein